MCIFGLFLSKSMQKRKQNQQKTHKMMRKPIKFCIFVIFLAKNTEKRIQQQRNTYKIQRKPSNSASFVCFLVKKHVKRRQIQQNTRQNAEKTKKVQSVANKCVISSFFLSQKTHKSQTEPTKYVKKYKGNQQKIV